MTWACITKDMESNPMTNHKWTFTVTYVVAKKSHEETYSEHKKAAAFQASLFDDGIESALKASKVA